MWAPGSLRTPDPCRGFRSSSHPTHTHPLLTPVGSSQPGMLQTGGEAAQPILLLQPLTMRSFSQLEATFRQSCLNKVRELARPFLNPGVLDPEYLAAQTYGHISSFPGETLVSIM